MQVSAPAQPNGGQETVTLTLPTLQAAWHRLGDDPAFMEAVFNKMKGMQSAEAA